MLTPEQYAELKHRPVDRLGLHSCAMKLRMNGVPGWL